MLMRPALVNVMIRAAEKAAKGLKRDFGEVEHLQISRKGPADFVSTADFQAQKVLREELGKARPEFGFLMEEKDGEPDTSAKPDRWIVDPLDGTNNFLHGLPHWCISIAAERAGEVVAGLVYNPLTDEAFWAEKGIGAYCSNKRLRVSGRTDFADCLLGTCTPFKGSNRSPTLFSAEINALMPKVSGIRATGSAALTMAYVAAGRLDGCWMSGLGPWDLAAGLILVREAGGFAGPVMVGQNPILTGDVIAANVPLYETFVTEIRQARASAV